MVKAIASLRFYGNTYVAENMTEMANAGFTIEDEPNLSTAVNGIHSAFHTRISFKTAYQVSKRESIMEHHGSHHDQFPIEAYHVFHIQLRVSRHTNLYAYSITRFPNRRAAERPGPG